MVPPGQGAEPLTLVLEWLSTACCPCRCMHNRASVQPPMPCVHALKWSRHVLQQGRPGARDADCGRAEVPLIRVHAPHPWMTSCARSVPGCNWLQLAAIGCNWLQLAAIVPGCIALCERHPHNTRTWNAHPALTAPMQAHWPAPCGPAPGLSCPPACRRLPCTPPPPLRPLLPPSRHQHGA